MNEPIIVRINTAVVVKRPPAPYFQINKAMCLIAHQIPASQRDANCVPCFKSLNCSIWNPGQYTTYFQYTFVPSNGVLTPKTPSRRIIQYGLSYDKGFIHAFNKKRKYDMDKTVCFQAYAFGVKAWQDPKTNHRGGFEDTLICQALYIPNADRSPNKRRRMQAIKAWKKLPKGPSNREVLKVFPEFKSFLK